MLQHLDHMLKMVGEDCVGLGSDFDGARVPRTIGDVAGLQTLIEAMRNHGFGEALTRKIASENWLRVLGETWSQT
jgi:membrane dipeptidase